MEHQLIQAAQIAPYNAISANINLAFLNPYIMEAQEFDLRPFLGEQMYLDLLSDFVASPSLQVYGNVYDPLQYIAPGSTYNYQHDGLVPVLAYFAYARYVENAGIESNKFGLVAKKTDLSDPISSGERARRVASARSKAVIYQERLKLYLDLFRATYPLWRSGISRKKTSFRITPVGGNSSKKQNQRWRDPNNGNLYDIYYPGCEPYI